MTTQAIGLEFSSLSMFYFQIAVRVRVGTTLFDPTGTDVAIAFTEAGGDPAQIDWRAANWLSELPAPVDGYTGAPVMYWAGCYVGPGGDPSTGELTKGYKSVWVRITGSEIGVPVMKAPKDIEVF